MSFYGQDAINYQKQFVALWHGEMVMERALNHLKQSFGTMVFPDYLANAKAQEILSSKLLTIQLERDALLAKGMK